jgi:hypothetical protein
MKQSGQEIIKYALYSWSKGLKTGNSLPSIKGKESKDSAVRYN